MQRLTRRLAVAAGIALATATGGALAHHGWSWAEADQIEISGTIQAIYIGPPHPTLDVETEDGLWRVELGNPRQTQAAGFVEGVAAVGDEITALGNRTTDPSLLLMKAVRISVDGATYDIYPSRIPQGS